MPGIQEPSSLQDGSSSGGMDTLSAPLNGITWMYSRQEIWEELYIIWAQGLSFSHCFYKLEDDVQIPSKSIDFFCFIQFYFQGVTAEMGFWNVALKTKVKDLSWVSCSVVHPRMLFLIPIREGHSAVKGLLWHDGNVGNCSETTITALLRVQPLLWVGE